MGSQEINLQEVNAWVVPNTPASFARFHYADLGGNVNFMVNGAALNIADLIVLDGAQIAGCDILVTEYVVAGYVYGKVLITALPNNVIDEFAVGGQDLYIDDVCIDCP